MIRCTPTGRTFKVFVKQTHFNDLETSVGQENYLPVASLTGDNAKQFYEGILNQPSSSPPKKDKPQPQLRCRLPQPKKFKSTDLLWMAQNNDVNKINKFLLQEPDCNVNVVDEFGWTPLMCASCSGAEEAVKILLKQGADPNICDKVGNTALKLAKWKNWVRIREMLENWDQKECENEEEGAKYPLDPFFCETCKENFMSKYRHECSTLHLFHCPIKTQTFYGIPESNKGFQLLLREGWEKEKGLGPDGRGRKFPVKAVMKKDRKGIGASLLPDKNGNVSHHTEKYENRKSRMNKMQKDKHFEKNFRLEFS